MKFLIYLSMVAVVLGVLLSAYDANHSEEVVATVLEIKSITGPKGQRVEVTVSTPGGTETFRISPSRRWKVDVVDCSAMATRLRKRGKYRFEVSGIGRAGFDKRNLVSLDTVTSKSN